MTWAYVGVDDLRGALGDDAAAGTVSDARLLQLSLSATRDIDKFCQRSFRCFAGKKYFTPLSDSVYIPDLLSVVTVKQDLQGDQSFELTWASTDYVLEPFNALIDQEPYTQILPSSIGRYRFWANPLLSGTRQYVRQFPAGRVRAYPGRGKSIEIDGLWGYWSEYLLTSVTLAAAIVSTTATTLTLSDTGSVSPGNSILIDSEKLYVQAATLDTQPVLTVERGADGTTAATHLMSAPVSIFSYPSKIIENAIRRVAFGLNVPPILAGGIAKLQAGDVSIAYRANTMDMLKALDADLIRFQRPR